METKVGFGWYFNDKLYAENVFIFFLFSVFSQPNFDKITDFLATSFFYFLFLLIILLTWVKIN